MRRLYLAVSASMLLLTLSACAGHDPMTGASAETPPPSRSTTPPTPEPVQDRTPVPADQVDFSQLPQGYPHTVWTQDGGTVVVVTVPQGGCSKVNAEATDQTAQQVTITMVSQTSTSAGMCPMYLRYVPEAVRLAAPLHQRKVVLTERDVKVPG